MTGNDAIEPPQIDWDALGNTLADCMLTKNCSDVKIMAEGMEYPDYKIIVQGQSFPCHKVFLSGRSEFFKTRFLKETSCDKLEIDHLRKTAVREILTYLYAGKTESENYIDLYRAAVYFRLADLVSWCEKKLCETLTVENVVECLSVVSENQGKELRRAATLFVVDQWENVKQLEEWKHFVKDNPQLTTEIIDEMYIQLSKQIERKKKVSILQVYNILLFHN